MSRPLAYALMGLSVRRRAFSRVVRRWTLALRVPERDVESCDGVIGDAVVTRL